ncbi:MAG: hopanoid biosynthesis associated radical SAM protein HpnJ [Rhodospirillaceae bacterium TMED8]|nr:hopanoid biosynthesis associated radical SAM protein HpnJ [Magnetovibrio sp.]OUT49280.1 MAG: hopanoid biosynthesis associated radical SAM protein HpnJ [Rhodospirillaceae bacterium TMED8]|tara:strand:+ start:3016 stop:4443 length:1428 start_codon:yes stop_codon:yes gene_type:complete
MKKTLFLSPPTFDGYDGGAGSRYQCKREVKSFWYPTWLAQLSALVPGSKLIDAPAQRLSLEDILPSAKDYEFLVIYTSTPSFHNDVKVAEALKEANSNLLVGFCGAHVAVNNEAAIQTSPIIDFVCDSEFDFTIQEIATGKPLEEVVGITILKNGTPHFTGKRPLIENMDSLPWVTEVYKRDLVTSDYYNGYMLHPYMSLYTGRGCKSRCTFCLWPQTIAGHKYRTRSVQNIAAELEWARDNFPEIKEFFFDDDTLTDDREHVEALARELGKLNITWSCNAKANVSYETLKIMRENGLRLLLVGYESGNQKILNNIKKGILIDKAKQFTRDCHELGIVIHGTFIVGLPGETRETIEETIQYAQDLDPNTIQVSLPAAYPGTFLYNQARENHWLIGEEADRLVSNDGVQNSVLEYPHLSREEIFEAVDRFYKRFYFRPIKMASLFFAMCRDWQLMKRQLREGIEFFRFLYGRENTV